jgi:hypothetical protein
MHRLALLLLPLLLLCSPAQGEGRGAWPRPELLARQFDRIAFSSEHGGHYRAGRLIRWQGPVRVRLAGATSPQIRDEVERQLAQLRHHSGLVIEIVADAAPEAAPGIRVEFSFSRGGTTFEPEAPCRTLIWEQNFVIERALVYISPTPDPIRRHCIAEELTQALGLADDSPLVADSIFNDGSSRQQIAPWDALMVRILYDPRLRAGMHRNEAMPNVRRIILEQTRSAGTSSKRPR